MGLELKFAPRSANAPARAVAVREFCKRLKGQRLFTDEGKPSAYVESVLKFLQGYGAQFERTQAFCRRLKELELLEPMKAEFTLPSGEKLSLTGFLSANREKIKSIGGEKLAELAGTDELELLYLHLQSMRNFAELKDRLVKAEGAAALKALGAGADSGTTQAGVQNTEKENA